MTEYDYDALNRLTAIRYPSSPTENISYTYDEGPNAIGRLTIIDDSSGQTTFEYDQRGNRVTDRRDIDGVSYSTHYAYNLANQVTTVTYPSGRRAHYELDNLGVNDRNFQYEALNWLKTVLKGSERGDPAMIGYQH